MDKMREEFEDWFFCTYHENKSKHHRAHVFAINHDGTYQCKDCERSWIGWVASRAALCVELPKITDFAKDSRGARDVLNFEFAVECVARELNDVGVRHE